MNTTVKLDPLQPRFLRYRGHYKVYISSFIAVSVLVLTFWCFRFWEDGFVSVFQNQATEICLSLLYFIVAISFYFFWLRSKLQRSVQVFSDHLLIHNGKEKEVLNYSEIHSVRIVCWSIFYVKMRSGYKHFFNSSLERCDYIWEGIYHSRPDLISKNLFEAFRVKLVQYDHHQKRKEWFLKHKLIDLVNWTALPVLFLMLAYFIQSRNIYIHQEGLYFFRLFMISLLVLLTTSFAYSMSIKKFIFDKKIVEQIESNETKTRDLEFEGIVLQRSKIFQMLTATFLLAIIIKTDLNFYSVSKVKTDLSLFDLKKGHTLLIDNRFNCLKCRYELRDGDLVVFGKGIIGQLLAGEGEMVGQITQDEKGRTIASENVMEVPQGHVAIRAANGKDIVFIRIQDLIGKIQK